MPYPSGSCTGFGTFFGLLLLVCGPQASAEDSWTAFNGKDRSGQQITVDQPDDTKCFILSSTLRDWPSDLAWALNEYVTHLRLKVRISSDHDFREFEPQLCFWTMHTRTIKNRKSDSGYRKDVVKLSLYCDPSGASPIAGSYYEARHRPFTTYRCVQGCANNPFRLLHKD